MLETLEIETKGELDLRGFLGIDDTVKPGYGKVSYVVRIKDDGSAEDFREIHETVTKTSPNYFNVANPVMIEARIEVDYAAIATYRGRGPVLCRAFFC